MENVERRGFIANGRVKRIGYDSVGYDSAILTSKIFSE